MGRILTIQEARKRPVEPSGIGAARFELGARAAGLFETGLALFKGETLTGTSR